MGWIRCDEQLPKKGENVIAIAVSNYTDEKIVCIDRLEDGEKGPIWIYTHGWYIVTHWMPLPEPPKEDSHEE